ncbi:MAG TPA: hypothetical protein VFQ05_05340 [Candidatus Eisenbacteria bacterium]|nr:hypothetical protein [Candidatus Eisenbacteria bacterium]
MRETSRRAPAVLHVLAAALTLTLLNALKPLTADDPSYYWHVQRFAAHPLDPYGGEMVFGEIWGPALHNVAPPVLIYWLALGYRLIGDQPQILKLWLLPFPLLLAGASFALLRRVAAGFERYGVWLIALSPAILPSLNLMLDVPALALSLAATALFLQAADRNSWWLAAAAGALTGLAIQTKYTGFTVGLVLLATGWLRGRLRLAILAGTVAAALFLGWEAWVLGRYGESQFFHFLGRRERGETGTSPFELFRALVRTLGPLASPLIPLGLVALGAGRKWVVLAIVLVAAAHVAIAVTPESAYQLTFAWVGPVLLLVAAAVTWRMNTRRGRRTMLRGTAPRLRGDFAVRFLTVWLAIELLAYLSISTFPAARRTLGVLIVLVLITSWLVSRAIRLVHWRRSLVWGVVALSMALGFFYFAVDLDDAQSERKTPARVRDLVAARGGGSIYYLSTSWCGFQFYAPREGLHPVVPGRTNFSRGDWLVIPWNVQVRNRLTLADSSVAFVEVVPWARRLPISTRDAYYRGTRPLRRPEADWRAADLYRVDESGQIVGVQEHPYMP